MSLEIPDDAIELYAARALLHRAPGDRRRIAEFVAEGRAVLAAMNAEGVAANEAAADRFLAVFGIGPLAR